MLDLLRQGLDRTEDLFANVKTEDYGKPTPCSDFDVKGLLNHIVGGQYFLVEVANGKTVDPTAKIPDLIGNDPLGAFKQAKEVALDTWSQSDILERTFNFPFGTMPGPMAFGLALVETYTHGWDLAKATGQDPTIPDAVAGMLLEAFKTNPLGEQFRTGDAAVFGPEVKVPDSASLTDKLVAYLGRTP